MEKLIGSVTRKEMHGLLDIIHNSLSCNTREDFFVLVDQFRNLVHFDHLLCAYGDLKCFIEGKEDDVAYTLLPYRYPDEWLNRYLEKAYNTLDHVAKAYLGTFELHNWRDIRNQVNNGAKNIVDLEAGEFGVNEGYIYGTRAWDMENITSLAFSGEKVAYTRRTEFMMGYAIPHFSECLIRILGRKEKKLFSLTPREREVLKWLKEGKTAWELSVILSVSERTVRFHVDNLVRKLNAVNSRQAVAIAMENGLV